MDLERMKVKAVSDDKIRRLDNKYKNKEVLKLTTLKDLDITDRTPIVVEYIEDDELEAQAIIESASTVNEETTEASSTVAEALAVPDNIVSLDDTPNLRSCLVNTQGAPESDAERFSIDILK